MNPIAIRARALVLGIALAAACGSASAQTISFNPRTGDVWVDTQLSDINRYGGSYRSAFVDEMVRYHSAPRDLVLDLLGRRGWTPGDVYFACTLAEQLGRPCRTVADEYERDRSQGWGAVAQRMGIQPGSAQFHALKRGIVPTYDRWGRPIRLDNDLTRDFPGRKTTGSGRAGGPAAKAQGGGKAMKAQGAGKAAARDHGGAHHAGAQSKAKASAGPANGGGGKAKAAHGGGKAKGGHADHGGGGKGNGKGK